MGWGGNGKGQGWGGNGKGQGWGNSWAPVWQPMFNGWKGKGKGKGKKTDPTLMVWLGNIPEGTDWKALQDHMNQAGKSKWVEVFDGKGKGTGKAAFSTAEEATNAVAMLNGSVLGGQAIMVDVWVKAPKEATA
ncbi:unnamed protein product [Polarella glacialis]|uniref:RRM domain-containing protein n=1 Tax=Polarella glacialis TaxID=89957 RepID=A0A813H838_POLGL|nr:unnamed protein product [Polarella glacialis]CAE8740861.1 unnamed protein product [Polarella glacialis]